MGPPELTCQESYLAGGCHWFCRIQEQLCLPSRIRKSPPIASCPPRVGDWRLGHCHTCRAQQEPDLLQAAFLLPLAACHWLYLIHSQHLGYKGVWEM